MNGAPTPSILLSFWKFLPECIHQKEIIFKQSDICCPTIPQLYIILSNSISSTKSKSPPNIISRGVIKYPSKSLMNCFLLTASLCMYTLIRRYLLSAKLISKHNNLPSVSLASEINLKDKFLLNKIPAPQLLLVPKDQNVLPSHNFENFLASIILAMCVSCRNTTSNPRLSKRVKIISCLNFCRNPTGDAPTTSEWSTI